MKDGKKWIYKRYEGKFAYFPIISTWHLVHGVSSSTEPGKKIASRPREWNIALMSPGMPRYPFPSAPLTLLFYQSYPVNTDALVPSVFLAVSLSSRSSATTTTTTMMTTGHSIYSLFIIRTRHFSSLQRNGMWKEWSRLRRREKR